MAEILDGCGTYRVITASAEQALRTRHRKYRLFPAQREMPARFHHFQHPTTAREPKMSTVHSFGRIGTTMAGVRTAPRDKELAMSQDYRLVVPQDVYLEMLDQARAELPNECCGLLAGTIVEESGQPPLGRVSVRYPLVNKLVSPVEFFSDEKSMFAAHRDMQRRGFDLLAIYHSHPISDPIPSRKDREQSYYGPGIMNLIISLKDEQPRVAGWWLTPEVHRSAEWALEE